MTIEISNHESSQLLWSVASGGSVSHLNFQLPRYFPACLWQTASVSPRTDTEPVPGIGFLGAAAVQSRIGSVDVSIDGFIIAEPGATERTLSDLDAKLNNGSGVYYSCTLLTYCDDNTAGGTGLPISDEPETACQVSGLWCNSITFTAEANAPIRFSATIVGDSCTWDTATTVTPIDAFAAPGLGIELTMAKDIILELKTHADGGELQTSVNSLPDTPVELAALRCTMTGNVGRRDAYVIGLETPFARIAQRPHDVTVSVEVYSSNIIELEGVFNPNFTWDPDDTATVTIKASDDDEIAECTFLRPSDASLSVNVGADVTTTLNFAGWKMSWWPGTFE